MLEALSDVFYADEQAFIDGNNFDIPFFDNAGYVANDQRVIFDRNHKGKVYDHPASTTIGFRKQTDGR